MNDEVKAVIDDIAYCLGELGFSKQHIINMFAERFTSLEEQVEIWELAYDEGDKAGFNYLFSRLPELPGQGQATQVSPEHIRPIEDLPLFLVCGEIESEDW